MKENEIQPISPISLEKTERARPTTDFPGLPLYTRLFLPAKGRSFPNERDIWNRWVWRASENTPIWISKKQGKTRQDRTKNTFPLEKKTVGSLSFFLIDLVPPPPPESQSPHSAGEKKGLIGTSCGIHRDGREPSTIARKRTQNRQNRRLLEQRGGGPSIHAVSKNREAQRAASSPLSFFDLRPYDGDTIIWVRKVQRDTKAPEKYFPFL